MIMKRIGIYVTYKSLMEKILKSAPHGISMMDLENQFNKELIKLDLDKKGRKTVVRIINEMIKEGYAIHEVQRGREKCIELLEDPYNTALTQADVYTFPILFGSLESEQEMPAVKKIVELVGREFGYDQKDLRHSKYFVKSEPEINNHHKIILLAGKLIHFAKKGIAIKYVYRNKEGKDTFKYVAPLQIRLYDRRYYLLGVDVDSETGEASDLLKNYCLDTFWNFDVEEAYYETENGLGDLKLIKFNHKELYRKSNLERKLENSLGIWYDPTNELKKFKLKFYDWAKGIVLNKKLHKSQRVIEEKENFVVISIDVWDNHEIDYVLDRFGDKCERLG